MDSNATLCQYQPYCISFVECTFAIGSSIFPGPGKVAAKDVRFLNRVPANVINRPFLLNVVPLRGAVEEGTLIGRVKRLTRFGIFFVNGRTATMATSTNARKRDRRVTSLRFRATGFIIRFNLNRNVRVATAVFRTRTISESSLRVLFKVGNRKFSILNMKRSSEPQAVRLCLTIFIIRDQRAISNSMLRWLGDLT